MASPSSKYKVCKEVFYVSNCCGSRLQRDGSAILGTIADVSLKVLPVFTVTDIKERSCFFDPIELMLQLPRVVFVLHELPAHAKVAVIASVLFLLRVHGSG